MDRQAQAKIAETKNVGSLLRGAIDLHYHGYPEITLKVKARLEDAEVLTLAHGLGMRGIVIKSQMWPTMGRVYHLRQRIPEIECFSSITLNSVAGGINPWVVEAAARQGARVVWFPTWSSAHQTPQSGFGQMMRGWFPSMNSGPALSCTDSAGKATSDVRDIIGLAKQGDLIVCTGHISPAESLAIAREAERQGFTRLVFTHPLSDSVGATLEEAKEMARRGAYIEVCALNLFHAKESRILELISAAGAGRCIISTDAFREWLPPGPELLRMFVGRLLMISGIDEESIRTMVQHNPAILLGLPVLSQSESNR